MTEYHSRLRELFIAACDLPKSEQDQFVEEHCSDDRQMGIELKQLLDSDGQASGFFADGNTSADVEFDIDTVVDRELPTEKNSGRYQLMNEIARGGMGAIIEARDIELGRDLAIKVLKDEHKGNPQIVQRFLEEAQIGGQLQHPGIAPIHEVGRFADGRPFISMKLIKGKTLATLLKERRSPSEEKGKFIGIFEQVCQTLAYAHSRGVIHRDLKPDNIMVGAFGEVQVMDWGLAKVLGTEGDQESADENLITTDSVQTIRGTADDSKGIGAPTHVGSVMGTPAYMPPEQALGKTDLLDRSTDVFALGAILCEILIAKPIYSASNSSEMLRMASTGNLERCFQSLDACDLDRELATIAKHCLSTKQADRPRDAQVLSERITDYLKSVESRLRETEIERAAQTARADEERKRRRVTMALAATVLLAAILGSVGWAVFQKQKADAVAATEVRINKSLNDARLHAGLADATSVETDPTLENKVRELNLSLSGAKDASKLAESSGINSYLQTTAKKLVSDLQQRTLAATREAEQIAINHKLQGDLDLIRLTSGRGSAARKLWESETGKNSNSPMINALLRESLLTDFKIVPSLYEKVFRESGFDLASQDLDDLTKKIKRSAVRESLISALDNWARAIGDSPVDEEQDLRDASITPAVLLGLAKRADSSEWRKELRAALAEEKMDRLNELASDKQVQNQPDELICWLGAVLRNARFDDASVSVLRSAQQRAPGDFWLNYELGISLAGIEGKEIEAIGYVRTALGIRPQSPGTLNELGLLLARANRFEESISAYQRAVEIAPDFAPAFFNLGTCLASQGKFDEAITEYRTANKVGPENAKAYWAMGTCFLSQNKVNEAILAYKQAIELDPSEPEVYLGLGVCFDTQNDANAAIAVYRDAIKTDPGFEKAYVNLGNALRKQGKRDQAIAEYAKAIEINSDNVIARNNLGWTLCLQGKPQEAETEFREAVAIDPDYAGAHFNLGNALGMQGNHKEAMAQFRTTIAIAPDYAKAHHQLAYALSMQGKLDEALAEFRTAIELEPQNAGTRFALASLLLRQLKYEDATAELKTVIQINPKFADAQFNLGFALAAQERFAEAATAYRRAAEINPNNVGYRVNLGFALREQGDLESAIGELQKAIELRPNDTSALGILGGALAQIGQLDEAVSKYRKTLEIDPSNVVFREELGDTLLKQDDLDEAISEYRKAVEFGPESALLHVKLGAVLAKRSEPLKALEEYQRAVAIRPDDAALHNQIAIRLVYKKRISNKQPSGLQEGLSLAERACELEPENAKFTLTLGIAQYRNGRWKLALESFKKSKRLNKKTDTIENVLFRVMAHRQLDEHEKSKELFATATQLMDRDSASDHQQELFDEAAILIGMGKADQK